ncbi:MAG: flavin reductase family protein [Leptospiraceae bacterium]|nr:flavin reductase family protein [Leptospiraceae bacterium]MCP5500557.1 flavin reductase family protein [Leptospiraceae bacterium]
MSISNEDFKKALSAFASGVTVITYKAGEEMGGLTVSSFASLSLEPPLILFNLNKSAISHEKILETKSFAVNILSADGEDVSNKFASSKENKHELVKKVGYTVKETGSPLLRSCLAIMDCSLESVYDGGDHSIIVGRALYTDTDPTKRPLLYYNRAYYKI